MQTEATIEIDRSIDEVFEFTNNHVAEWSQLVVEDTPIDEKPGRVGSTFRCVTEEQGRRMEFTGTVTRHDPPYASAVHMVGGSFEMDVEYAFEAVGDRTRLTQRSTVVGKGLMKLMLAIARWTMKKSSCRVAERELENLKRLLEARNEVPVDGSR